MSARNKARQGGKPASTPARRSPLLPGSLLVLALVAVLAAGWWLSTRPSGAPSTAPTAAASDLAFLKGRWQREDGGMILDVKSIADTGVMEAAYLNPRPIHVAQARATRAGDVTRVFVELRDANYPGSTYNLTYLAARDRLEGVYFQAVARESYVVGFTRVKP